VTTARDHDGGMRRLRSAHPRWRPRPIRTSSVWLTNGSEAAIVTPANGRRRRAGPRHARPRRPAAGLSARAAGVVLPRDGGV